MPTIPLEDGWLHYEATGDGRPLLLVPGLGGVGTFWGPLVGAAILIPLGEWTRIAFGGTGKAGDLLVYGALIMLVSVIQPGGIMALAMRGRRRTG